MHGKDILRRTDCLLLLKNVLDMNRLFLLLVDSKEQFFVFLNKKALIFLFVDNKNTRIVCVFEHRNNFFCFWTINYQFFKKLCSKKYSGAKNKLLNKFLQFLDKTIDYNNGLLKLYNV